MVNIEEQKENVIEATINKEETVEDMAEDEINAAGFFEGIKHIDYRIVLAMFIFTVLLAGLVGYYLGWIHCVDKCNTEIAKYSIVSKNVLFEKLAFS